MEEVFNERKKSVGASIGHKGANEHSAKLVNFTKLADNKSTVEQIAKEDLEQMRVEFHKAVEDLIIKMQNFMDYLDSKKEAKE